MGIRILLGENHVYAIVVTANTRKKIELKATPAELRSKVFEVLESLASRALRSQAASRRVVCNGRGSR